MVDILLLGDDLPCIILVRLPCANLDQRIVGIPEVDHQEKESLVTVSTGMPVLLERDAVYVIILGMLHDVDILKLHIDVFIDLEDICQLGYILLLGLLDINDLVVFPSQLFL